MVQSIIMLIIIFLAQISELTHIVSYAFCPFIFGGTMIFAIIKLVQLEPGKKREILWSVFAIILAVLVLVFVGLNTFLWRSDLLFYIFIPTRFTLLLFLLIIANPYIKWSPLRGIFTSKESALPEK